MLIKVFLIFLGMLFLAVAVMGVFIPGLPTTPFLLLSAGLFFYSSEKLYYWISHHKFFGEYIRSFRENRAISRQAKIRSVILMWIMISISAIFFIENHKVIIIIILAGVVGTAVMIIIPTLKK
jgi:uncharacterized membrane protein YbaN (DUF454 family)